MTAYQPFGTSCHTRQLTTSIKINRKVDTKKQRQKKNYIVTRVKLTELATFSILELSALIRSVSVRVSSWIGFIVLIVKPKFNSKQITATNYKLKSKALKCWCLGGGRSLVHMHSWMHRHTACIYLMHASNNTHVAINAAKLQLCVLKQHST